MELGIHIYVEQLPEGGHLATSDELPGLGRNAKLLEKPSTSHGTSPAS